MLAISCCRAAWAVGHALPDPTEAALAKIAAAETAQRVANEALQIFGSYGYSREEPLERLVRDARMFTIAGGTAEALRNLVGKRPLRDSAARLRHLPLLDYRIYPV